jgi:predicted dithiol-disulfide oxidoreductase (DUF899 family)
MLCGTWTRPSSTKWIFGRDRSSFDRKSNRVICYQLMVNYQWLDRAPRGRNETGLWFRRHDEYDKGGS